MKKRITALVTALFVTLFCLPLYVFTSGTVVQAAGVSDLYEADDLQRYGTDEEYAIVPCNAGGSSVDLSGNGKDIHLWKTHRKTNQRWKLKKVGDYYAFVSVSNGKVIDVPGGNASSGVQMQIYDYHGGNNQLWRLESMGDGTYCIHSKINDSFVWDVWGAAWDNGAAIQLYGMYDDPNERFRFVHTSTIEPMAEWGSTRRDCKGSNWSVWDGSCSYDWYYNHRNERDLYINTAADLFGLTSLVANGHEMLKKTIHLTCDINLAGITWTPIGYYGHFFRGSFNGHNHAIIGFNRIDTSEDSDNTGLFGSVSGGTICNLAVKGTIAGDEKTGGSIILGCYNNGEVHTKDNDYVGGICGYESPDWCVICCINDGRVYGRDQIGGISGEGRPIKCLNTGVVTGRNEVGAIGGNARSDTPYCYALAWSAANLSGKEGSRAEWVTSSQILSGEICYKLNYDPVTYDDYGITAPLSQNIGSDPMPTFGSSAVKKSGSSYMNSEYRVTAECERGYGSVEGAGAYQKGNSVTLTAKPAAGCIFDHFEVKSAENGKMTGWNGSQYDYPTLTVKTYKEETITLTNSIDKSYTVRAVFKIFDDTPDDMKVKVKVELECTDDADGWNSNIIPVDLVDSAGEKHRWDVGVTSLDEEKEKVSHTFDLGTASPVAVYVYPDFGGGLTFRSYGLKARMWVNESGSAMESSEVIIRSWPFVSSLSGDDYMNISFENYGNSTVGGSTFTTCKDAWSRAKTDSSLTLRLDSAWLLDSPLELNSGQNVTLDLNGYPIIRTIKKTQDDGELFKVGQGATLTIVDSAPSRKSSGNFTGGSIQGGRSDNTGGLIECQGTLVMTGGTLYNGGTIDKGGAIKLFGSAKATLTGVLISNCWTDKATFYNNEGGAIYMKDSAKLTMKDCTIRQCRAYDYGGGIYLEDDGNRLSCENVNMVSCTADDNQGGGVYQDHGETNWIGGSIKNCRAPYALT